MEINLHEAQVQKRAEIEELKGDFELPEGSSFETPDSFVALTEQLEQVESQLSYAGNDSNQFKVDKVWYEPGYFKSDALVQWQCAWLKEAVIATESGDQATAENSLKQLYAFKDREEIKFFPDYDVFLNEIVRPLEKKQVSDARAFINSGHSCVEANRLD